MDAPRNPSNTPLPPPSGEGTASPPARSRRVRLRPIPAVVLALTVVAVVIVAVALRASTEDNGTDSPPSSALSTGTSESGTPPAAPEGALKPRAATWASVTGPSCPVDAGSFFRNNAAAGDHWTDTTGGWGEDGCQGSAIWSVSPGEPGPAVDSIVWQYEVPENVPGLAEGPNLTCHFEVYVPDTAYATGLAVYFASTKALEGDSNTRFPGTAIQRVDQSLERGRWVDLGAFTTTDRTFALTGADDTSSAAKPTVAMSAARLSC